MPIAQRPVFRSSLLLTVGLPMLALMASAPAMAASAPMFVDAPGDLRGSPAKVSTSDLSVQFDSVQQARAAAQEQGATFVHLPHISAYKGYACGYFEYTEASRNSDELAQRRAALEGSRGLVSAEYVFRTMLPVSVQTPAPAEVSAFEQALSEPEPTRKRPNDPKYDRLWGMKNISAEKAWEVHTDASNIVLFLTDSGINLRNDDIKENLWKNKQEIPGNGIDDDKNGYVDDVHGIDAANGSGNPQDRIGHGSHCACTIAGRGNNGFGVAGVAWKLQIAACKAFKDDGTGKSSWQTKCFEYMIGLKKRGEKITVTSNSWGAKGDDPNVKAAFEAASDLGLIHAVAAGNYGDNNDSSSDAIYPASYDMDSIISVIWTNKNDSRNRSSNYGRRTTDLAAPGTDIYSCHGTKNGHYNSSGTSMATPHVGGALALMSSYARKADAATLRKALLDGVDKISSLSSACATGGRLNVAKALSLLEPSEEEEEEGSTGTTGTDTSGEDGSTGTTGGDAGSDETEGSKEGDTGESTGGSEDETETDTGSEEESEKSEKEDPDPSKTPDESEEEEEESEEEEEESEEDSDEDSDGNAAVNFKKKGGGCQVAPSPAGSLFGMLVLGGLLGVRRSRARR